MLYIFLCDCGNVMGGNIDTDSCQIGKEPSQKILLPPLPPVHFKERKELLALHILIRIACFPLGWYAEEHIFPFFIKYQLLFLFVRERFFLQLRKRKAQYIIGHVDNDIRVSCHVCHKIELVCLAIHTLNPFLHYKRRTSYNNIAFFYITVCFTSILILFFFSSSTQLFILISDDDWMRRNRTNILAQNVKWHNIQKNCL